MNPHFTIRTGKSYLFLSAVILFNIIFYCSVFSQSQSIETSPTVDGKINEGEWTGSKVITDFHMINPKSDAKNYDSTIVYIKQTHDALYFAFKWWPKAKVISKSLRRDRSSNEESEFFIMLDLENKGTNGYFFAFSFLNNQRDALVYNVRNQSQEWDWVWFNKSTVIREAKDGQPGYIETEVKIPVDKMQNKNTSQIGLDVQMFAYKPDGTFYTYSLVKDAEVSSLKSLYKLDIKPFDEKANIKFTAIPYIVGNKFNDSTYKAELGGEFQLNYNRHTLKSTINTDKSTLEADPFTFNFYGRPTFLSEKRPFLSKDLDIYRSQINLFYTRAIENIDYGFNYTYRDDKMKIGSIYIREGEDNQGNRKDFFVSRPKYTSQTLNAGGMLIYRNDPGHEYQEKILSIDGFYRFPNNRVRLLGQVAHTANTQSGNSTQGTGFNLYSFYEFDNSGGPYYDASYSRFDKYFKASTSFNSQVGSPNDFDELSLSGGYNWNIARKYFSNINVNGSYYRASQLSEDFNYQEKWSENANFNITGPLNFFQSVEYNKPNDFDESGNLITRTNILQEYDVSYVFGNNAISAGYYFGTYFGNFIKNPYVSANFFFFNKLAVSGSVSYFDVFDTKTTILNTRMDYKVMDKLYLRSFFQTNTGSKQSLWNTLVQYEFFAGSNFYFVLNLIGENLQHTSKYLKLGYEFNF
ncbi:hypothetical protein BH10BAC5_BH10BAC5_01210 [soil metagenome]